MDKLFRDWPIKWMAIFTFLNGLLAIVGELFTPYPNYHYPNFLSAFLPFGLYHRTHTLTLVFGFFLIYLSYHIYRRKIIAWCLVTIILVYFTIIHVQHSYQLYLLIAPFATLALLFYHRKYFVAKYNKDNILQGIKLAVFMLLIAIALGTAGFWFLDKKDFGINFHLAEALIRTLREYFLIGNYDLIPKTVYAAHFLRLLRFLGMAAFFLAIYSIFKPLYDLQKYSSKDSLALKMAQRWGNSSLDFFKLWPNKNYFLPANSQGFIAYKVSGEVAIGLGDPIAPKDNLDLIVQEFITYCKQNGWLPSFYCATPEFKKACDNLGLKSLRIGQELFVNLGEFVNVSSKHKDFQRVLRKFEKNHHTFECLEPPHFPQFIEELRLISNNWLQLPGRKERNFAVGYFDKEYLSGCRIFVVRNAENRVIAFANEIKSYKKDEATIDLMRYEKSALNGAMDFIFIKIFSYYFEKGYRSFDLGLALVSKDTTVASSCFKDKALQEVYQNTSFLFSSKRLSEYKKKFKPSCDNRYLIYWGNSLNMFITALALTKVSKIEKIKLP